MRMNFHPEGQWQVKQAPGWKVVARRRTLAECAIAIQCLGGDPTVVSVTSSQHPWPTLGQLLAEGKEPS